MQFLQNETAERAQNQGKKISRRKVKSSAKVFQK
jgi:hypothetical protein